jgi:RNA polymerase sigma-70 factor (ECF subfamily)
VRVPAASGADDLRFAREQLRDADAFAALVRRHDRSLRALAYRLLGDRDRMDDVLQEAYVKAFRSLRRVRRQATVATWLYRIVYNACLDELRRGRTRPAATLDVASVAADERDPAEATGTRAALAEALAALPPEQRAAVLLVDADGFDYRAAAKVLEVSVGTLASRLSRARSALRRTLSTIAEGAEGR